MEQRVGCACRRCTCHGNLSVKGEQIRLNLLGHESPSDRLGSTALYRFASSHCWGHQLQLLFTFCRAPTAPRPRSLTLNLLPQNSHKCSIVSLYLWNFKWLPGATFWNTLLIYVRLHPKWYICKVMCLLCCAYVMCMWVCACTSWLPNTLPSSCEKWANTIDPIARRFH